MANIKNHLDKIKNALFGQEVRGSIHDGIDAMNKEVESTTGRQVDLEKTFDQLVINAGNSNAEIVDARVKSDGTSYSKLGDRLNEVDSQLAHIENKAVKMETITDDASQMGVHINYENANDINIQHSNIETTGYSVLLNQKALNGKNIRINDNKIVSKTRDAIELNTPNKDITKQAYSNAIISNNFLKTEGSDGAGSGFTIGICQTNNVSVFGNVIESSFEDAFHVEKPQKNVLGVGNIFDDCKSSGFDLYYSYYEGIGESKPIILNSNHFAGSELSTYGLIRNYNSEGNVNSNNFANNRFAGFNTGIMLSCNEANNITTDYVGGSIIQDCEFAIESRGKAVGDIITDNCNYLFKSRNSTVLDRVISATPINPLNLFVNEVTTGVATIKQFEYCTEYTNLSSGTFPHTETRLLMPKVSYLKGNMTIRVRRSTGGHFALCNGEITYSNSDNSLTFTKNYQKGYGALSNINVSAGEIGTGNINVSFYTNAGASYNIEVIFSGVCFIDGSIIM